MRRPSWNSIKDIFATWRVWGLPGAIWIGLIVAARLTGSLQGLELFALDTFLRLRSEEPPDDRIVLVGFDNLVNEKRYPIPEQEIIDLIKTLESYKPSAIGLHIHKNQIAETEKFSLFSALGQYKSLIVSELVAAPADQISAPSGFLNDFKSLNNQVGFLDTFPDKDNYVRRLSLGLFNPINNQYSHSLAVALTQKYLVSRDASLRINIGIRDTQAMRFGSTEIPRLHGDSGGYIDAEVGFPELLLKFRNSSEPFQQFTVNQIKSKKINLNQFRDRIVIVGITDPDIRYPLPTAATTEINSLQIQAHAVSQMISAVLDGRSLINTWSDPWEYLWITGWGVLAIVWGHTSFSNRIKLTGIAIVPIGLIGSSYLLLLWGWWIPIVPVSLVWLINGLGYTAFYKYDWVLRSRLKENQRLVEERQQMIEQIFNVIHNGPLQTLASVLRQLRDSNLPQEKLVGVLENLNIEIRQIGEHAKQETLTEERSLYLGNGIKLDLQLPIDELLYEVYSHTLDRSEFSSFETLKVAYDFEPVDQPILGIEQRRSLCRFLEEALCNVGKHAEEANHLIVTSTHEQGNYVVRIVDDGVGVASSTEGEGTRYARKVAAQFKGKFKREPVSPKGTLCQLSIPLTKAWWGR
ncbi:MAG: CHASE2 domain-containing protein [Leptolyngbyaceae cyanobacterium bins.302]|nr:CHASE2 domain-containing protein [Leptolyngbyaceae cyanobacterium bins.302]